MRFSQDTASHGYTIHAVSAEGVTVRSSEGGAVLLKNSFIIRAGELIRDWEPRTIEQLRADYFTAIVAMKPEVVVASNSLRTLLDSRRNAT